MISVQFSSNQLSVQELVIEQQLQKLHKYNAQVQPFTR